MVEDEWLTSEFDANRRHLHAVAYRMLGSQAEADDALQETWIRLHRSDTSDVANLGGWLTTVVARVCLNMLRSRTARREEPMVEAGADAVDESVGPEHATLIAESIGPALLVVLETLTPAERVAFVLHDLFAVPFDEIAPIVGRSPAASRQLASRARRRVQGAPAGAADHSRQRAVRRVPRRVTRRRLRRAPRSARPGRGIARRRADRSVRRSGGAARRVRRR